MDDGDAGESDDNRGGHYQGIVVEIPCKGQSIGSAVRTAEGNSLRKLVEAGICTSLEIGRGRKAEDRGHPRATCEQSYQQSVWNSPESDFGAAAPQ